MKYSYQDIYDKAIFNRPIWACNYKFDIEEFGEYYQQEPIQGEIIPCATPLADFIPYNKNGELPKTKKMKNVSPFTVFMYADTEQECKELYCDILQGKIDWCQTMIKELNEMKGKMMNESSSRINNSK